MDLLKNYINDKKELFEQKQLKQKLFSQKILFSCKNGAFSLEDINNYKEKTKGAVYQNEINSIARVMEDRVVFFHTATINPKFNLSARENTFEKIDNQLKLQYSYFKKFHRDRKQYKLKNEDGSYSRLDYKFIRVYELSEAINLHSHCIDILNTNKEIEHYLKGIILSRKNNSVGRVELAITESTFNYIKKLFKKGFFIRVQNKYIQLHLIKKHNLYTITNINDCKKGNFIYFKILNKNKQNPQSNITKYIFKYLLKSKSQKEVSKDEAICNNLKIRQQQFSKDFFSCGIRKDILYRVSNNLYSKVKNNHSDITLKPTDRDKKSFIYHTAKLFQKSTLFKMDNYIFYTPNHRADTQWVIILDTKKYDIEVFKEKFSTYDLLLKKGKFNNSLSKSDYVKCINDKIRELHYEDGLSKAINKPLFHRDFTTNKPYLTDLISEEWLNYQKELEYEEKLKMVNYMENTIDNYYTQNLDYKIECFEGF